MLEFVPAWMNGDWESVGIPADMVIFLEGRHENGSFQGVLIHAEFLPVRTVRVTLALSGWDWWLKKIGGKIGWEKMKARSLSNGKKDEII